jgi:cysteinyl-tRNA synthetase
MLKLYNSLTKQKEAFKPIRKDQVTMYSCGPTVYDHATIGNLRAFLLPDLLQRVLRYVERYNVAWVMNITDIDDKMIARAHKKYPKEEPMDALNKLADEYTDVFLNDIEKIGILRGDITRLPRATDHITGMQTLIKKLVKEGIAYVSDGSVYFSIEKYRASGKDYGRLVDLDFTAKARVTDDQDQKEGVADFALWKAAKEGEPQWDFEISGKNYPGRPGWHIECSVMSTQFLGKEFDIHTGGVDLKFPHHENELAQCGGVQAHYYLHNEHLIIESEKMSKSLGNFITIDDLANPMAYRYLVLSAHYRSQIDFSRHDLDSAYERIKTLRAYSDQLMLARHGQLPTHDKTGSVAQFTNAFQEALRDDLNTPKALAALSKIEGKVFTEDAKEIMRVVDAVFGLQLVDDTPLKADVLEVIDRYEEARLEKKFELSDQLRKKLLDEQKLIVSDTPQGTLVHRLF